MLEQQQTAKSSLAPAHAPSISIGIIAWNEENAIRSTLESLFAQSLFERLGRDAVRCEIICLANACTDRTAAITAEIFSEQNACRPGLSCRVAEITERGKANAWNVFVHRLSARDAKCLFLMDADIAFQGRDTLWNMLTALEENPAANIATDRPCKSISSKPNPSLLERLSLLASRSTQAGEAQLCGQLYCIRSETARRIFLPRDLGSCDDGFIKALVCTDFLTGPVNPARIVLAKDAAHMFDAYTSIRSVLKNQKRQAIGQAILHCLVDDYLKTLPPADRADLAAFLREKERVDPDWIKELMARHARRTKYFWRLIPGLAAFRFRRLARLDWSGRFKCLPTAVAGSFLSMVSCVRARAHFKKGCAQYWPHARTSGPKQGQIQSGQF